MFKRLKVITSQVGYGRFLDETTDTPMYLARFQTYPIPSPYQYSPSVRIMAWKGKNVVGFETAHRRFEVFEVPPDIERFNSESAATDAQVTHNRLANSDV